MKIKPNKRLYNEFLLNQWISKSENQRRLIKEIFSKSTHFKFKEVEGIVRFESILYNADNVENSGYTRFKRSLREDPEAKTQRIVEEVFYERYAKNYVIKASIVDFFGLRHNVILLCEIRAGALHSPFLKLRLDDLQLIENEGLYDPKLQQLKRNDDQLLLIGDKTFAVTLITMNDATSRPVLFDPILLDLTAIVFRVPKEELKALERENRHYSK